MSVAGELPKNTPPPNAVVEPTGDWEKDNQIGRQLARTLRNEMRESGQLFLLGHTVMRLQQDPKQGGVLAGMLHEIAVMITLAEKA